MHSKPRILQQNTADLTARTEVHARRYFEKQAEVGRQLGQILGILDRVSREKEQSWHERVYAKIQSVARYVGIPALALAAVIPVYNLGKAFVEYTNDRYVRSRYADYISSLLEKGEIERAKLILSDLENMKEFSAQTQYLKAKTLALRSVKLGRDSQEAQDRINLLLTIHDGRKTFFPNIGGDEGLFGLKLALVDIDIELQQYKAAAARLAVLDSDPATTSRALLRALVAVKKGTLSVLQYQYNDARRYLEGARTVLAMANDDSWVAECDFQLGKCYQFENDYKNAFAYYGWARESYERKSDDLSLLKVYNNIATLHFYQDDLDRAYYFYKLEEQLSRKLSDDKGLGRSVVNLSLISRKRNDFAKAVEFATEALEAFRRQGNKLGLASGFQSLANLYKDAGDLPKALYNAKQALIIFQDLKEVRGMSSTLGTLAYLSKELGDSGSAVSYFYSNLAFSRYFSFGNTEAGRHDMEVFVAELSQLRENLGSVTFANLLANAQDKLKRLCEEAGFSGVDYSIPKELHP